MNLPEFKVTLSQAAPPQFLSTALQALWFDANGDWDKAHRSIQHAESGDEAWVHAYLHRKEGDRSNATYWYRAAGRAVSDLPLPEEWEEIVAELLSRQP